MKTTVYGNIRASALALVLLACLVSYNASAQFFQMRLVSSAYAWQLHDTVGHSSDHLFGYQTAQLSLSGEHVSFHTYFQGFNDFSGPTKNEGLVRFYDFYVKYSGPYDKVDLSLGRQYVFAGVGYGTIDGGMASVRLLDSKTARARIRGSTASIRPETGTDRGCRR